MDKTLIEKLKEVIQQHTDLTGFDEMNMKNKTKGYLMLLPFPVLYIAFMSYLTGWNFIIWLLGMIIVFLYVMKAASLICPKYFSKNDSSDL